MKANQIETFRQLFTKELSFKDQRKWRSELHGVRGIAILLVVTFHIFSHGRVSGGIDIFLAITGFLAVPSLYRRALTGNGFIALIPRIGGLVRRLFVPLVPVLVFVAIVGPMVVTKSALPQLFAELFASTLFAENIELIISQLSYNAAGPGTSPLQHLWSTSIQMQFHLVMPLAFMLLTIPLLRRGKDPKKYLIILLAALTVASFAYATHHQFINQRENYFSSLSRTWELTLPGILGLVVGDLKIKPSIRAMISWLGLGMIFSTGFIFDGAKVFPGPEALLPVGGLLFVLLAGETKTSWGADQALKFKPIVFIADISYSLYLWHWPINIFYLDFFFKQKLSFLDSLIVISISILLGYLGKKLFENKLASVNFLKNNWVAVASFVVICLAMAPTFNYLQNREMQIQAEKVKETIETEDYPGAEVKVKNIIVPDKTPEPDISTALISLPSIYWQKSANFPDKDVCTTSPDSEDLRPSVCESGDVSRV